MEAVYLDTHIIVWLHLGDLKKFSKRSLGDIEDSDLLFSSIAQFEMQYLFEIGRLNFNSDQILQNLHKELNLTRSDTSLPELVKEANKLSWTRDPFDRLITAQSSILELPLITKDKTIRQNYPLAVW